MHNVKIIAIEAHVKAAPVQVGNTQQTLRHIIIPNEGINNCD
jgi:hypothetical protein